MQRFKATTARFTSVPVDRTFKRRHATEAGASRCVTGGCVGRGMDWITTDIAIGSVHEARNADLLRRNGVRSILGLIDDLARMTPVELGVGAIEIVPLVDGEGNDLTKFCRAVAALSELVERFRPV